MNSVDPTHTSVSKNLQYLFTLSSVLESNLIAEISQGLPTNAKF